MQLEEETINTPSRDSPIEPSIIKPSVPKTNIVEPAQPNYPPELPQPPYYYAPYGDTTAHRNPNPPAPGKPRYVPKSQTYNSYQNSTPETFNDSRDEYIDLEELELLELFVTVLSLVLPILVFAVCLGFCVRMMRRNMLARQSFRHPYHVQHPHYPQRVAQPNLQSAAAQIKYHQDEVARLRTLLAEQQQRQPARQHQNQNAYEVRNFNYNPYPQMNPRHPEMMRPEYISLNDESQIPVGRPVRPGEFDYPRL